MAKDLKTPNLSQIPHRMTLLLSKPLLMVTFFYYSPSCVSLYCAEKQYFPSGETIIANAFAFRAQVRSLENAILFWTIGLLLISTRPSLAMSEMCFLGYFVAQFLYFLSFSLLLSSIQKVSSSGCASYDCASIKSCISLREWY